MAGYNFDPTVNPSPDIEDIQAGNEAPVQEPTPDYQAAQQAQARRQAPQAPQQAPMPPMQQIAAQGPLSQAESQRLTQLQSGLAGVDKSISEGTLADEEGQGMKIRIQKQLAPLLQRQQATQAQAEQKAEQQAMKQAALQETIMSVHRQKRAQGWQSEIASFMDPVTGDRSHFYEAKPGHWEELQHSVEENGRDRAIEYAKIEAPSGEYSVPQDMIGQGPVDRSLVPSSQLNQPPSGLEPLPGGPQITQTGGRAPLDQNNPSYAALLREADRVLPRPQFNNPRMQEHALVQREAQMHAFAKDKLDQIERRKEHERHELSMANTAREHQAEAARLKEESTTKTKQEHADWIAGQRFSIWKEHKKDLNAATDPVKFDEEVDKILQRHLAGVAAAGGKVPLQGATGASAQEHLDALKEMAKQPHPPKAEKLPAPTPEEQPSDPTLPTLTTPPPTPGASYMSGFAPIK